VILARPAPPDEAHDAPDGAATRDYSVAYAVNPKTGTVHVAFFSLDSTVKKCLVGDAVYRVEADGRLAHMAGGCVNGEDDFIAGGLHHMAADPASGDLVTWGVAGAFTWLSKGKSTKVYFSDLLSGLPSGVIRGAAFDGAPVMPTSEWARRSPRSRSVGERWFRWLARAGGGLPWPGPLRRAERPMTPMHPPVARS
jgi:hypothetical protein